MSVPINTLNRYKYTKSNVDLAIQALRKGTTKALAAAPSFLRKYPDSFVFQKGKLFAVAGQRKLAVVPTEDREDFLREIVYGKKSEYPFGRDSLFAILKDEVMNVSKRDIEGFLNAQGPLVHRRSKPPKLKRESVRRIGKIGILSVDLAHIRANDFKRVLGERGYDYMGVPGKRGYQQDRYFLNAVDLLTGYLWTEVIQGKEAQMVAPALVKIMDRFKSQTGQEAHQVEVDKGGEFRGQTSRMFRKVTEEEEEKGEEDGPFAAMRLIPKVQNATVEQTNAKMQRIFWALVAQRRGGFLATVKQAVKISNRTYNRRIRMNPEDALKKALAGEKITKQAPKAGPTERKKAWKVGQKVRALKKPRSKEDLAYKAYKGDHYGAVTPISKVRYYGVNPRYKVGDKWHWGDEVIRARPTDTKAHNLVIARPVVLPPRMRKGPKVVRPLTSRQKRMAARTASIGKAKIAPKPKAPKKAKAKVKKVAKPKPVSQKGPIRKNQDVWFTTEGVRVNAKVVELKGTKAKLHYLWEKTGEFFYEPADVKNLKPAPTYEIEDEVQIYDNGMWHDAEVDKHAKNGNYRVFWREDGKRWSKAVPGGLLRPLPK